MANRRGRPESYPLPRCEAQGRLGREMRELRQAWNVSLREAASESGWSRSRLSNAELGRDAPTREMVRFYEERFEGGGILQDIYGDHLAERSLRDRRTKGRRGPEHDAPFPPVSPRAEGYPLDRSHFVADVTIPDDTVVRSGEEFEKVWEIKNAGQVVWEDRYLTRQGPPSGPELMESPARVPVPKTPPGENARIAVQMRAPLVRDAKVSISIWKMTDENGGLFFPEAYSHGLTCQVIVLPMGRLRGFTAALLLGHAVVKLVDDFSTVSERVLVPDQEFIAAWKVRNVGSVPWRNYSLVRMGAPAGPATPRAPRVVEAPEVPVGETADIKMPMRAPSMEGSSQVVWQMFDEVGSAVPGAWLSCLTKVQRRHEERSVDSSFS